MRDKFHSWKSELNLIYILYLFILYKLLDNKKKFNSKFSLLYLFYVLIWSLMFPLFA
jgi:hypothetical protein